MARRSAVRDPYLEVVRRSKPVFHMVFSGNKPREMVRAVMPSLFNLTTWRSGPFPSAGARDFNGSSSDATTTSHASYHPGDTFSVGGWVRRDGSGTGGHIFLHNGTGDFVFWIDTANKLVLRRAGTGDIFSSTATYTDTPWMHAVAVKNGGVSTVMYVNGVAVVGTSTSQTVVASSTTPTIGTIPGGGANRLDGAVFDMAIWSRALSRGEVQTMYRAGRNEP